MMQQPIKINKKNQFFNLKSNCLIRPTPETLLQTALPKFIGLRVT